MLPSAVKQTDAPPAPPTVSAAILNPSSDSGLSRTARLQAAILLIWGLGVLAVLVRTLLALGAARGLLSRCRPISSGSVLATADEVRQALGVGRCVRIVEGAANSGVVVPMTCGVFQPVILLPADAHEWMSDRLRVVLLHEMAHVRRFDWGLMLAAQTVCAFYWFNPFVWVASNQLRAESEGACDDMVLSSGVRASDYAEHLLEIVRRLVSHPVRWQATVAMAHRPEVTGRVHAILTPDKKRGVLAGRVLVSSALLLALFVGSLAALRPTTTASISSTTAIGAPDRSVATPPPTTVVVASGEANQGRFTMLDVTGIESKGPVTIPPAIKPSGPVSAPPLMAGAGGTGLWIGVQDGIGFRTLSLPAAAGKHSYSFGKATLVLNGTATSFSSSWTGTYVSNVKPPYQLLSTSTTTGQSQITLVPTDLSKYFRVTAQPLSSTGKPLGQPISLVCQPASANAFFAQIPTGYNAATKQMQVTVTAEGSKEEKASWRLTGLPQSVQSGKSTFSPTVTAAYGPLVLRAAAIESEDLSGDPSFFTQHPARPAGGQWFFLPPPNADGHGWTGAPTIHFILRGMNTSKDFYGQDWMVRLGSVTPEWQTSPAMPISKQVTPIDVFPVYHRQTADNGEEDLSWETGVAYPGQQHWVRIDGEMLHFVNKKERVTFHDADVVQDHPNGVNRLVWSAPETETTPSGISISVLNERNGKLQFESNGPGHGGMLGPSDTFYPPAEGPEWRFQNTNVPVLLAWNMPPSFVSRFSTVDAPLEVSQPELAGSPYMFPDHPLPVPYWYSLATPGQTDGRALSKAGYLPLCLPMDAAVSPQTPLPFNSTEPVVVAPASPPRHIKSIKVQVWVRVLKESRPFHLVVPVRSSFPAGWDPHAGESRSSMP